MFYQIPSKITAFVIAVFMALMISVVPCVAAGVEIGTAPPEEGNSALPETMLGDLDGSGKITAADARVALLIAAKSLSPTREQEISADYDGSGKITAADARYILRVAARIDPYSPLDPPVPLTATTGPVSTAPTTTAPVTEKQTTPPTTKKPTTVPTTKAPQVPAKRKFPYVPANGFYTKYGYSAAIYDYDNDKILYGKNMYSAVQPASTTKLMTAYVASKYLKANSVITVGSELNLMDWNTSKAGIYQGLRMTFSEMLKCLLLPSGCDAAYAIAAAAARAYAGDPKMSAGSAVATFVNLMNNEAKKMGMTGTTWTNPDGFPDARRPYTTAHDMIIVGAYCYGVPLIRNTVKLTYATAYTASGKAFRSYSNTNELMNSHSDRYYRYCVGMKTGSHSEAGQCLVSAAVKNGRTFIAVVYRCSDKYARYYALTSLYNTAFKYYM